MRTRVVKPEILDTLPENDPAAIRNRRDIRLLNRFMGVYPWLQRVLREQLAAGEKVLEIGAGAGDSAPFVEPVIREKPASYAALDLAERPAIWPDDFRWLEGDLLIFGRYPEFTAIVGNLILHQFDDPALRAWWKRAEPTLNLLVVNEPRRAPLHRWQLRAAYLLGLNYVSRHDGQVSINAGFRGQELPEILELDDAWQVDVQESWLGSYRMVASRRIARN